MGGDHLASHSKPQKGATPSRGPWIFRCVWRFLKAKGAGFPFTYQLRLCRQDGAGGASSAANAGAEVRLRLRNVGLKKDGARLGALSGLGGSFSLRADEWVFS